MTDDLYLAASIGFSVVALFSAYEDAVDRMASDWAGLVMLGLGLVVAVGRGTAVEGIICVALLLVVMFAALAIQAIRTGRRDAIGPGDFVVAPGIAVVQSVASIGLGLLIALAVTIVVGVVFPRLSSGDKAEGAPFVSGLAVIGLLGCWWPDWGDQLLSLALDRMG